MSLLPYPTEVAPEAWQLVWDSIRNKEIPSSGSAVHVGWNLLGYVAGKVYPAGPIVIGATVVADLTEHDEAAVNAAFAQLCQPQQSTVSAAMPIPWGLILQVLRIWWQSR